MDSKMAGEDFVHVRMSAAGERMAGEGKRIQLVRGRRSFIFVAGEVQRVERNYEWVILLSDRKHEGELIFEIAPPRETPKVEES